MDIRQVADRAGVSTATVSRVLNGATNVRDVTRERVCRAVEELGYVRNSSARALRSGRSFLYGIIVSDIKNPFFPDLIDSFEGLASQQGIDLIFTHTNYGIDRLHACYQRMLERNVDGIAVMTSEVDDVLLRRVAEAGVPVVFLNQPSLGQEYANILVDYTLAYQDAVAHLYELGHREIAFIAGPLLLDSASRRRAAFLGAMRDHGLTVRPEWGLEGDHRADGGMRAMQQLLQDARRPTAVMASNDLTAVGALGAVLAAGLSVPGDVSLVGFDDLALSSLVQPPLTTIHLSRREIAHRAFEALQAAVGAASDSPPPMSITPRLIVRGSTSHPRPVS